MQLYFSDPYFQNHLAKTFNNCYDIAHRILTGFYQIQHGSSFFPIWPKLSLTLENVSHVAICKLDKCLNTVPHRVPAFCQYSAGWIGFIFCTIGHLDGMYSCVIFFNHDLSFYSWTWAVIECHRNNFWRKLVFFVAVGMLSDSVARPIQFIRYCVAFPVRFTILFDTTFFNPSLSWPH